MKKEALEKRKLIRLDLDADVHQLVRVAAAKRGISMAEFARVAVSEAAKQVNRGAK